MRNQGKSHVPAAIRIGAGALATVLIAPAAMVALLPAMLALTPFATIAIPIIAVGLRGDATGKPPLRRMVRDSLPPEPYHAVRVEIAPLRVPVT